MNHSYYKKLAIFFISILILVFGVNIISKDNKFSETENRVLQEMPKFTLDRLLDGRFFKKFDKYKSDQFTNRDFFIKVKALTDLSIGKREINDVYFCDDEYLIENFSPMSNDLINKNIKSINDFSNKFKDSNIFLSVVPTSISILEDKLPSFANNVSQTDYISNFYNNLNSEVKSIDVYKILNSLKNDYIYYKTDHHYTTFAAHEIYNNLKEPMNLTPSNITFTPYTVSDNFNGTLSSKSGFNPNTNDSIDIYLPKNSDIKTSVSYIESQKKSTSLYNLDKLSTKDKYAVFLDGNHPIIDINTSVKNDKKLLILKDSYANALIPFLVHHYSKITVVDPRYYYGDFYSLMEENKFDDILIYYNANTFFSDDSLSLILNNE